MAKCTKCEGEGQVANTDQHEPWSLWEQLPAGSDAAVRSGLVRPIPCLACGGSGESAVALPPVARRRAPTAFDLAVGFLRDERRKQVEEKKGFTAEHDDEHTPRDWLCLIDCEMVCLEADMEHGREPITGYVKLAAVAVAAIEAELRRAAGEAKGSRVPGSGFPSTPLRAGLVDGEGRATGEAVPHGTLRGSPCCPGPGRGTCRS